MKRGSRFLIGFASAALTFGSLFAFAGPEHFNKHCGRWGHGYHHNYYHNHSCSDSGQVCE